MALKALSIFGRHSVLVLDMFDYDNGPNVIVTGFPTREIAREYAQRRTRDSLEQLREPGISREHLRSQWYMFGEDCIVLKDDYKGAANIDNYIDHPATAEERDWESIEKLASRSWLSRWWQRRKSRSG